MKKIPRFAEAAWICGIVFCAFGVALTIKADFGVSMIAAPPYILHAKISEYFPSFTLGTTEYCFQGVLLLVMLAVVRRIRLKYFMCFLTAVIYGKVLDLMLFLLGGGEAYEQMPVRIVVFAAGGVITSLAIAFFFRTYLPLQIYELFVTECAAVFNKPNEKVKYIFDGGCLLISVRVTDIIRTRFLQADFRRYFVKILENPQRIFCVLCLVSSKILTVKNLRPEDEVFLLDFWG